MTGLKAGRGRAVTAPAEFPVDAKPLVLYDGVVSLGIKVYGTDDEEKAVKEKLIFI